MFRLRDAVQHRGFMVMVSIVSGIGDLRSWVYTVDSFFLWDGIGVELDMPVLYHAVLFFLFLKRWLQSSLLLPRVVTSLVYCVLHAFIDWIDVG